ncbi:hypothetical protein F5X68DRAFT_261477 [Plectosphaerella plurivora]|uniref:Uncharacterized protein n=1 Tax=Plectosphaerella plurivora TaxID=936078 RepID=A0A9P9AAZ9_9PEZI|nr:hypothetical protein F5X68DRAFT_261477 [Plectosphaerella plurivora]
MEAPPSSQFRADTTYTRAKFADLTEHEITSCDPFLVLLTRYNQTDLMPTDRSRKVFWTLVFEAWDTNTPILKPVIQKRTANGSSIKVGTLTDDCPVPGQATKRKNNGTYVLPAIRRRHADVLLKLSISTDGQEISYKFTDSGNSLVPRSLVQLDPGYTIAQARAMLVRHWDKHEATRVSRFNENLTIYWARKQLVTKLEEEKARGVAGDGPQNAAAQDRPTAPTTEETTNVSELVKLRLAWDILEIEEQTANHVRRISHGVPRACDNMVKRTP